MSLRLLIVVFVFAALVPLRAQEKEDIFGMLEEKDSLTGGYVKIIQSEEINEAVQFYLAKQSNQGVMQGYRINIFFVSEKKGEDLANLERARFIEKYPDIGAYVKYDVPFFKVYVGDFRTKTEALKVLKLIEADYPNTYIVQDDINLPEIE